MVLCKQDKRDRLYYNGHGKDVVGFIKAYYDNDLLLFKTNESLAPYYRNVRMLLEHIERMFPNSRALKGLCENERRIYSCSRNALKEYGFHCSDGELSFFVKVNKNKEFNIFVYHGGYNGKTKTN